MSVCEHCPPGTRLRSRAGCAKGCQQRDLDESPTITLTLTGTREWDDCEQASLLGILRSALENTETGRDLMDGRSITATTTPIYTMEPYVSQIGESP